MNKPTQKQLDFICFIEGQTGIKFTLKLTRKPTQFNRGRMSAAMKEACKQTLELAAENASVEVESKMVNIPNGAKYNTQRMIVNKKSILDIINQIE